MKLSVVICTYNRADLLPNCINSVLNQTAKKDKYEIVIVDNNSTDETKKVIKNFEKKFKNISYTFEQKQGISFARNKGYLIAKGYYIAYIDDDAKANKSWVESILAFTKEMPEVNIFGGPYDRFTLTKIPNWFPEDYGKLSLGKKRKIIEVGKEWITESNLIIKKNFLKKMKGFKSGYGHIGNSIAYGEGPDLLMRAVNKGEKVYYDPKIKVKHLVLEKKFSVWWLLKSDFARGRASKKFPQLTTNKYTKYDSGVNVLKTFIKSLQNHRNEPFKRTLYLSMSPLFGIVGYFYESLQIKYHQLLK